MESDGSRSRSSREASPGKRPRNAEKEKKEKKDRKGSNSAILDAINGLGERLDNRMAGIEQSIGSVKSRVDTVETKLSTMNSRMDDQQEEMQKMKEDMKNIKEEGVREGNSSGGGNNNNNSDDAANTTTTKTEYVPMGKLRILFVGGWPEGVEKTDIETKLRDMTQPVADSVKDVWATHKVGGKGKIEFTSCAGMWNFLKSNKETRWEYEGSKIYCTIDKSNEEIAISSKVSKAVKLLKEHFKQHGGIEEGDLKKYVDGEWNLAIVYFKEAPGATVQVIYERLKGHTEMPVREGFVVPFAFDAAGKLAEINGGGR